MSTTTHLLFRYTALAVLLLLLPTAHAQIAATGPDVFVPRASDGAAVSSSVNGICVGCQVGTARAVISDTTAAAAQLRLPVAALGSASLRVTFPMEQAAGRYAGFLIRDAVGLIDLTLLQSITLTTYRGGTAVQTATGAQLLRLGLLNGGGTRTIDFLTAQPFDAVQITAGGLASVAVDTRVFYAYSSAVSSPAPLGQGGVAIGYGTIGACAGCQVLNPGHVLDADLTNETTVTVPGGVTGGAYLDVAFPTQIVGATRVGFVTASLLTDAELAAAVTVRTYLAGVLQESGTGAALTVRALGDGSGRRQVTLASTLVFDEVRIEIRAVGGLGAVVGVVYAYAEATVTAAEGPAAGSVDGLAPARPNPARQAAQLALAVAETQRVRVAVYDATGREVAVLLDEVIGGAAQHAVAVDAARLPAGVYVVRAVGETFTSSRTLTVVR